MEADRADAVIGEALRAAPAPAGVASPAAAYAEVAPVAGDVAPSIADTTRALQRPGFDAAAQPAPQRPWFDAAAPPAPQRPGFDAIFGLSETPSHPTPAAPVLGRRVAAEPTPLTEAEQADLPVGPSSASTVSDAGGASNGVDALFMGLDVDEAPEDEPSGRARRAERGGRPSRADRKAAKATRATKASKLARIADPRQGDGVPAAPATVGDDLAFLVGTVAAASSGATSASATPAADAATGFATAFAAAATAAESAPVTAPISVTARASVTAPLSVTAPPSTLAPSGRREAARASHRPGDDVQVRRSTGAVSRSRAANARLQATRRPAARAAASAPAARRRRGPGRIASVVAMSFVALLAVATTIPALSLLSPADVQALALANSTGVGPDGQRVELNGDIVAQSMQREGYETQTLDEYARAAGIRPEATFTNNPAGTIQWPFAVGVHIGDHFGYRDCAGCSSDHGGQDFNPGLGAEIQAIADGTVAVSTDEGGSLGVVMMIDHMIDGQLITSVYAHMEYGSRRFEVGDTVHVADIVGTTGSTGMSTGPHLHFEIRVGGVDGTKIDPLPWLYANTN